MPSEKPAFSWIQVQWYGWTFGALKKDQHFLKLKTTATVSWYYLEVSLCKKNVYTHIYIYIYIENLEALFLKVVRW